MKRCVAAFKSEGRSSEKAKEMCNAMWYAHQRKSDSDLPTKTFSGSYNSAKFNKDLEIKTKEINGVTYDVVPIVAAMGDIFYQGVFVSKDLLRAVAEQWEGTIHDISHKATSSLGVRNGMGVLEVEDATKIIGFHKNAHFDEDIGGVVMDLYVSHNAPDYKAWKNYIEICRASGRVPNTSMFGLVSYGVMKSSELPEGVKVSANKVFYVKTLKPRAVTTCLHGKCNDQDGCGIGVSNTESCPCDEEYKKYLEKRIKEFEKKDVK